MNFTLADQYYLKALDEYSYNFEETVEYLNYALSYDSDHAGANYLMGRLYMEHLNKYELAEVYFISAMSTDPDHIDTCESFTWLLIKINRFKEARRLIKHAYTIKGVDKALFLRLEALSYELTMDFSTALSLLNQARFATFSNSYIAFLQGEINRISQKQSYCHELNHKILV